jgi:dCMP deaminase
MRLVWGGFEMNKWDIRFLQMATFVATWSKDPSTSVGAVIADTNNRVIGLGYNGFPRGVADDERLYDRTQKYKMVIHAEENAILNSTGSPANCIIYLTHPPCLHCAGMLKQAGIFKVVFEEPTGEFKARWNLEETTKYLDELQIAYSMFRRNP